MAENKRGSGKRELVEPNAGDKRFARRDAQGRFSEQDDVSRSLSQDARKSAKHAAPRHQGDRGDHHTSKH
jgi:hypothetical protein